MAEAQWQEVKAGEFIKWTQVGQTVEGTLIGRAVQANKLAEGKKQVVYTILKADGEQVRFAKGNIGEKGDISPQMDRIKIGQIFRLVYDSNTPSKQKGMQDFKLVKVYTQGVMNEEWLKQRDAANIEISLT